MTPLKDTLDTPNHPGESALAQGNDQSKPGQGLRSDAVSLDVPVKVHGSRVTDVVLGITSHTEPFEEETATMIVFPQGGVLKMSTPVTVGQMVVLTNLKSGHDAICRIVKVRAYAQSQSYVEIEFTNRQPGYWGVLFTADAAETTPQKLVRPPASLASTGASNVSSAAAPVVPVAADVELPAAFNTVAPALRKLEAEKPVESEKPPTPMVAPTAAFAPPVSVVKPPQPVAPAALDASRVTVERTKQKPESSFVGIGAQEDVQLAASDTVSKKPSRPAASPSSSLSMAELRGDGPSAVSASPLSSFGSGVPGEVLDLPLDEVEESASAEQPPALGRLAMDTSASQPITQPAFGSRFDSGAMSGSTQESAPRQGSSRKLFIGLGVAAALVLAAAGPFYFHAWPFGPASPTSVSATGTPAAPDLTATASRPPASNSATPTSQSNLAMSTKPSGSALPGQATNLSKASKPPAEQTPGAQPVAPTNDRATKEVPNMFGALNAHPTSSATNSRQSVAAPLLDPGLPSGNEIATLESSGSSGLVAPLAPGPGTSAALPVPLGGDVKPPRLLHSVEPMYPSVAKTTGVEGKVVIDTSIDKNGSVTVTKVISGPLLLRQAALDALSHWKYQPATLNGDPIAVQFTVVIDFHR